MNASEYKYVFNRAKRSSDAFITILYRVNQLNYPRLGLAISKKQIKSAVKRNLVKRIARESFRIKQYELSNIDIVVLIKSGIKTKQKNEMHQLYLKHWDYIIKQCKKY